MNLNLRKFANPYFVFSIIWSSALIIYLFGWSQIFPLLSRGLISFIIISLLLNLCFAYFTGKLQLFSYKAPSNKSIFVDKYLFFINLFVCLLNFAYSGIPLIKILSGEDYDYRTFGMPSVIVFFISFNSFLCIYYYNIYLVTRQKKYLIYLGIGISYYVLIYSRGMILITGMSLFFLWLSFTRKRVGFKFATTLIAILLLVMYIFGVAGNIRTEQMISSKTGSASTSYNNTTILKIGGASDTFQNSIVPNEFFWSYIYIASPISNLQYNVDNKPTIYYTLPNISGFVINELLFDFISKRLNPLFSIKPVKTVLVVDELTVSTIFAESFMYLGWVGALLMLLFMLILPVIYIFMLGVNSEFLPLGLAVLTCIYFFSFFDNMIIFSGLGLQLVYPFFLKYFVNFNSMKLSA